MSGPVIEEPGSSPRSTWPILLYLLVVTLIFSCGMLVRTVGASTDLSSLSSDNNAVVYDRHGLQIGLFHPETNMVPVTLETMAPILIDAVLVSLDPDYLAADRIGVWPLVRPVLTGDFANDPASITQLYLRLEERTPNSRRTALQEASKVIHLERTYPREALLEQYLSRVPLGRNAFGVEAASISWFGVSSRDLEIGQAAYLAAQMAKTDLTPNPGNSALTILTRLYEAGMVTEEEYLHHRKILSDGLRFSDIPETDINPAVSGVGLMPALEQIYDELSDHYGRELVIKGDLAVVSTVDLDLQSRIAEIADEVAESSLSRQVAVVILDDRNQLRASYSTGGFSVEDIQLGSSRDVGWSSDLIEHGLFSETAEISLVQLAELHSVLARKGIKFRTHAVLETFDTSGEQVDRFSHEEIQIFDSQKISELSKQLDDLSTIDKKIGPSEGQIRVQGKKGFDVEEGMAWYGGTSRRFAVALWVSDSPGQPTEKFVGVDRVAGRIFSELHRDD